MVPDNQQDRRDGAEVETPPSEVEATTQSEGLQSGPVLVQLTEESLTEGKLQEHPTPHHEVL